ncbi:MAG: COX15/CtaA family protein, partial [Candidatus Entotheonellia bacterium]
MALDTPRGEQQVWLHRFALFTAVSTFPLLFMGGLVTSTGAGLAVPDWPTTFGYHMFLYPWSKMVGGIFYEHSHRLIGSAVGLLTTWLCLWLWLSEPRPWLRWTGTVALIAVIGQGVLGGLRVVMLQHTLAIIHACFAQAFFALMVSIALFTSPQWMAEPGTMVHDDAVRLRRLCLLTSALLYLQVVFGAVLRHTGTRLDAHLLMAALVAIHVCFLAVRICRKHARVP